MGKKSHSIPKCSKDLGSDGPIWPIALQTGGNNITFPSGLSWRCKVAISKSEAKSFSQSWPSTSLDQSCAVNSCKCWIKCKKINYLRALENDPKQTAAEGVSSRGRKGQDPGACPVFKGKAKWVGVGWLHLCQNAWFTGLKNQRAKCAWTRPLEIEGAILEREIQRRGNPHSIRESCSNL